VSIRRQTESMPNPGCGYEQSVHAAEAIPRTHDGSFACQEVSEETYLRVLRSVVDALDDTIPYAFMGGLASAIYGRPRWSHDIDIFVRQEDAAGALRLLGEAGFATDRFDERWIYKAISEGVLVDVIFRAMSEIYFDDEMMDRTTRREFRGVQIPVIPPEDLVVIKATVNSEGRPRHWYDALGVLIRTPLDWPYLLRRARHGAHRVASLLLYAQSEDIPVPSAAVQHLVDEADAGT
jgi:predicted nucleotidyltransferase